METFQNDFIHMLQTELEDLIKDIELLMEVQKQRLEKSEITNYVYLENTALFKNEIACLKNFLKFSSQLDLDGFQTHDELGDYIKQEFKNQLEEHCYAQAIESFVDRKLKKIIDYIKRIES
ncbi:MAG: hypothetical protein JW822_12815 [Spirochaetales bacterium]|nr:hypothetical protein [Spirochaetales bacterium]